MEIDIQYFNDSSGAKRAVQIPFQDCNLLADDYRHLQQCNTIRYGLAQAFNEVAQIEKGKKKPVTLNEFLNEC